MIRNLWLRLQLLFAACRVYRSDQNKLQVQGHLAELLSVQRVEMYGLSYHPLPGSQAYVVFPGGDRAQGLALVVGDKRYQLAVQSGEVALHDHQGNYIKLAAGQHIEAVCAGDARIQAGGTADLQAGGDVALQAGGAIQANCAGDAQLTAGGHVQIQATQINLTASTAVHIAAPVISMAGAGFAMSNAGGAVSIQSSGALAIDAPGVTHQGSNIGQSHTHPGITPGNASTGSAQ